MLIPVRKAGMHVNRCLRTVLTGTAVPAEIILMDCTASPGALEPVRREFPRVRIFDFGMNPGRAHAVNTGIHITRTPYVMTLSPRLVVGKHCVERLCRALDEDGKLMSVQARILSAEGPARTCGAGWKLSLGTYFGTDPVIRGNRAEACAAPDGRDECTKADTVRIVRGRDAEAPYVKRSKITAAQMEAAVYRMEYIEVTGILDERYYGRLEDLDLGYRGKLCGFHNLYEPRAACRMQAGCAEPEDRSAKESRFYRQLETGNIVYFRYKFGMDSRLANLAANLKTAGDRCLAKVRAAAGMQDAAIVTGKPGKPYNGAAPVDGETGAALERGRMLCFQAEMEYMEREELGMSVTKQTLPEECCLFVREDGPVNVYPLYVGERANNFLNF